MNRRQFLQRCGRIGLAAGAAGSFLAPERRAGAAGKTGRGRKARSMLTLENAADRHFVIRRDDSMCEEFPELCLLRSGKLLCVYKVGPKHGPGDLVVLLESDDRGRTWKPHSIGFGGHGHDRIIELPDGSWINTTCERTAGWNFRGRPLRIVQYRSTDKGKTWKRDAIVADIPAFVLTEATTVLLADGKLVSYIRESSGLAHGSVRAVSTDNGRTWKVARSRGVEYGVDTTHFGTSYRASRDPFDSQDHFRRRKVVGRGQSVWRRVRIAVENPGAASDTRSWDAADGTCPDRYQRDRMVEVKFQPLPNGQGGPSRCAQAVPDGLLSQAVRLQGGGSKQWQRDGEETRMRG